MVPERLYKPICHYMNAYVLYQHPSTSTIQSRPNFNLDFLFQNQPQLYFHSSLLVYNIIISHIAVDSITKMITED